jgi:hypothetical protein
MQGRREATVEESWSRVDAGSRYSTMEAPVRRIGLVIAGVAMVVGMAAPAFASTPPTLGPADHVKICHATGSRNHPYVLISPSVAGIVNGHLRHQDQRDVVPPFIFRGRTYSQNWTTEGQAFLAGGCVGTLSAPPPPVVGGGGGGGTL